MEKKLVFNDILNYVKENASENGELIALSDHNVCFRLHDKRQIYLSVNDVCVAIFVFDEKYKIVWLLNPNSDPICNGLNPINKCIRIDTSIDDPLVAWKKTFYTNVDIKKIIEDELSSWFNNQNKYKDLKDSYNSELRYIHDLNKTFNSTINDYRRYREREDGEVFLTIDSITEKDLEMLCKQLNLAYDEFEKLIDELSANGVLDKREEKIDRRSLRVSRKQIKLHLEYIKLAHDTINEFNTKATIIKNQLLECVRELKEEIK
jgi:predicted transcriptional regulator